MFSIVKLTAVIETYFRLLNLLGSSFIIKQCKKKGGGQGQQFY